MTMASNTHNQDGSGTNKKSSRLDFGWFKVPPSQDTELDNRPSSGVDQGQFSPTLGSSVDPPPPRPPSNGDTTIPPAEDVVKASYDRINDNTTQPDDRPAMVYDENHLVDWPLSHVGIEQTQRSLRHEERIPQASRPGSSAVRRAPPTPMPPLHWQGYGQSSTRPTYASWRENWHSQNNPSMAQFGHSKNNHNHNNNNDDNYYGCDHNNNSNSDSNQSKRVNIDNKNNSNDDDINKSDNDKDKIIVLNKNNNNDANANNDNNNNNNNSIADNDSSSKTKSRMPHYENVDDRTHCPICNDGDDYRDDAMCRSSSLVQERRTTNQDKGRGLRRFVSTTNKGGRSAVETSTFSLVSSAPRTEGSKRNLTQIIRSRIASIGHKMSSTSNKSRFSYRQLRNE